MTTVSTDLLSTMNGASTTSSTSSLNDNSPEAIQSRFLKLLTVQMQNQDPTNPMDNSQLTTQLAQLAEGAALALGMDYAGVDLMPSPSAGAAGTDANIQVIEVNGVAAWQGLQRVTGFNIARAIVDDLLDRRLGIASTHARLSAPRRA